MASELDYCSDSRPTVKPKKFRYAIIIAFYAGHAAGKMLWDGKMSLRLRILTALVLVWSGVLQAGAPGPAGQTPAAAGEPAPPPNKTRQIYRADFEQPPGEEWSVRAVETTPKGGRRFLGPFASRKIRLTLKDLPPHQFVRLSFDLYIINSGGVNSPFMGMRCVWATVLNGPKLLHSTFAGRPGMVQSFPELEPWSSFPSGTGAAESGSLGYASDQVYKLAACFPHQDKSLTLNFAGDDLGYPTEETWGLNNVRVEVVDRPPNARLTERELAKLCDELAGDDPVKANHALWELVAAGDKAVGPIQKRLFGWDTSAAPNESEALKLISQLDQDRWQARDAASARLKALLPGAAGTMRRILSGQCSLEARARLERILQRDKPDPEINGDPRVRGAWAMAVLADTPQSVAVLYSIANISASAQVREIARMAAIRNSPTATIDPEPKSANP